MMLNSMTIFIIVVFFLFGFLAGFWFRKKFDRYLNKIPGDTSLMNLSRMLSFQDVRFYLVGVVTIIWMVAIVISFIDRDFRVELPIHAAMGSVIGFFFVKNNNKSDKDAKDK